jgi:predicted MPP superfamily phosphohydrolase
LIDCLAWLHVSDFHFKATGDTFSQTVACNALLDDVVVRAAEHAPISFVLVSGDVAYSGQPQEYVLAAEFMHKLASRLSLEPDMFFFVPGNHDVDRHIHDFARLGALQALSSQQAVDHALGDSVQIADLIDRQTAYRNFVKNFATDQNRTETPDGLGYVAQLGFEPIRLAMVGLNSAWLCGADRESNTLIIGERQMIGAFDIVSALDPHITIAMAHHPIEWLTDWDQLACRNLVLTRAHFLHGGHLHQADVSGSPHRDCLVVAAGSAHASRFYPNSYNIVSLDLGAGVAFVHEYRYQVDDAVFEAVQPIDAPCQLGGAIPGTLGDLADAIDASDASVAEYANYMAALLLGQKAEIPMLIGDTVTFVSTHIARDIDPNQAAPAITFLRLRNLLRLYDPSTPLALRVKEHVAIIEQFGTWLSERADADATCRARIAGASSHLHADTATHTTMPHTAALLAELRARQEWDLLESQARRTVTSSDVDLARIAKQALAQALLHSDEGQKRLEAQELSDELVGDPAATDEDYLLACAASEVRGASERSAQLLTEALAQWPRSAQLISYGRGLATRTGNAALRVIIDGADGSHRHE